MISPLKTYKYRAFNNYSWQILTDQKIYFSSPKYFNDPKDCKIPILFEIGTENQMYHNNLEKIKELFPKLSPRQQKQKAKELAKSIYLKRNDEILKKELRESLIETHSKVGIFSTSLIKDNKLMWSHYSDSHKGFCIEFNIDMLIKSLEMHLWKGVIPIFKEVNYTEISPRINPYILNDEQVFMALYFTKSIDWAYEKEYRFLIDENANKSFELKPNTITSIILGSECSSENEKRMKEVLNNFSYQISLKKITYDDLDYNLLFEDILY